MSKVDLLAAIIFSGLPNWLSARSPLITYRQIPGWENMAEINSRFLLMYEPLRLRCTSENETISAAAGTLIFGSEPSFIVILGSNLLLKQGDSHKFDN